MEIKGDKLEILKSALKYAVLYSNTEHDTAEFAQFLVDIEDSVDKREHIELGISRSITEYPRTIAESYNTKYVDNAIIQSYPTSRKTNSIEDIKKAFDVFYNKGILWIEDKSIDNDNSINYLDKVKEFMITFDQPVHENIIDIPEDRNRLRISLIFEELREYAEASGQIYYFEELCENWINKSHNMTITHPHPTFVNQVEQLDALLDLQYVLSGAVHEHGFGNIFDEAFQEVHKSNMSKACVSWSEAMDTITDYKNQDIKVSPFQKGDLYIIKRDSDSKVLKSINYNAVNLKPFIDGKPI